MKILDLYLARTVISGTLMALLVLAALLAFVDFVSEIGKVGNSAYPDYGVLDVIMFVLLTLPKRMYEIFPTAVLLGSLLSLGTLASNSELTVMRASGLSIMRISASVLKAGLVLVLLVAFVGEVLVPISERTAQTLKVSSLQQNISLGGNQGFWVRDDMRYVHVGQVYPDLHLGQLEVYEFNQARKLTRMTHADSARFENNVWKLRDIKRSTISDPGITSEQMKQFDWPDLLNPDIFNVLTVQPENMSALDLFRYSKYLQNNELDASHYLFAFWIKVVTPISSLVMLLIALPFVFSSQRSGGAGQRVLIGLLLGIGFFMVSRIMNHLGQVYGVYPLVSAALPMVLVAIVGTLAIRKVQ